MGLSVDLRQRVVEAVLGGGLSRNAAAKRFGVSIASAVRWVKRFETTGRISPAPSGGDRRSGRIEVQRDYLLGLIRRTPDITLLEIQERLIANCGERFSVSVLWRFFDCHGMTFSKKTAHAQEQQRPDVQQQRREWFARQLDLDPRKLVFIDETGASTNLARKSGRCRRGRRLRAFVPHGHYKTVTLVAGVRLSGLTAPKVYDRPINAVLFEEWVEKCLVPTLAEGDIVVMDNLSSHKGPKVEQIIKAAGADRRYLPPYRPDMNPIEKAFSKLKACLRKIAERTVAGLIRTLETCADIFKPAECENYFNACGYDTG
ncbi:IS630 family transposase [Methylocapsa sp. D3K7]|uniref:IS630 family transposase n=1 Tax=Methylocapsa sp. D3K7 TaxID=3041435 RepID=UPI00244E7DAA|nr:IS630 family transposase [Methylocapsa sp. D3K7]WGJ13747.1 IS630 family transposase [Methylocapsa sp. D3K7]